MILAATMIMAILLPAVSSYDISLSYSRESQDRSAFNFITEEFSGFDDADISFIGYEDRLEGLDNAYLYSNNWQNRIVEKDALASCADADFSDASAIMAPIFVGRLYCLRTSQAEEIIELQVTSLADDWSTVSIRFPGKTETLAEQSVPEEELEIPKQPDTSEVSSYPHTVLLVIDLLLIIFIIWVIIELRRF